MKSVKAYGPGVAHLEKIIQESIQDIVDTIQAKDGEPIETHMLSAGYICCVLTSIVGFIYSHKLWLVIMLSKDVHFIKGVQ